MAPRKAVKKRTCPSSGASPSKGLNMRWVPEGMDSSTTCRIAVRVPDYAHSSDDGRVVREPTKEFELVVDRDTTNLKDLTEELVERINLAENQGITVAFWNRNLSSFCNVSSDSVLMDAMDLYWEIRRVPLFVTVYDTMSVDYSQSVSADHVVDNVVPAGDVSAIPVVPEVEQVVSAEDIDEHQMGPEGTEYMEDDANLEEDEDDVSLEEIEDDVNLEEDEDDVSLEEDENLEQDKCQTDGADENVKTKKYKMKKAPKVIDEEPRDEDDVEYVGLHDEHAYLSGPEAATMNDNESTEGHSTDEDELYVDDEAGCEVLEHVTDLENPTIAVGETFEDAETFKRAIRQYAVLNEFEISAHYSEAKRYRGFCKGRRGKSKKCRWRIHASQLQDGKTWQIKKLYNKHNCASTAKLDNNCMATNAWVRDRVIDTLRDMPNTGAAQLKTDLESKYSIKLSYYKVWDGRRMALEQIMRKWTDSFEDAFNFKAELERTNPGSIVDIEYVRVGKKMRFSRMFVALKPCVDGFLNGCRPFLGVDSTVLTGRWRGQLASACGIDGHNWLYPVAYGMFESESKPSWKWFFEKLQSAIGSPHGLVISTDAGKGIDHAVTDVFANGVEHRECMRHLVKNFQRRYRGAVFKKHLWPACRAYHKRHYGHHYNAMLKASPNAIKWIEDNHKHLWNRWKFSPTSKCDYVTNNIAETFNSWVRKEKAQPVISLMDRIRQMIMEKHDIRRNLAQKLYDKILPHITKELNAMSRNLKYVIHKGHNNTAEIQGTTKELKTWRHTVDLDNRTCSCNRWQITGLPCTHALCLINSLRNRNVEDYVDDYYSVELFKKAYDGIIMPMTDRNQWPKVNMGFKLWPPILKRAAGRPRTRRIKGSEEGGKAPGRQMQCKRCGQFGHMMKTCNEPVYDSDVPPPAKPKPKKGTKKAKAAASSVSTHESQTGACSIAMTEPLLINSPAGNTRSKKRKMDLGDGGGSSGGQSKQTKGQQEKPKKKTKKQLLLDLLNG